MPPGVDELTPDEEAALEHLMVDLLGAGVWRATALVERLADARPTGPDHYYLSLFGTRPEQRGRGLGMALLADNLARIDAEGRPAYLESTNPANLERYRSVGFVDAASFSLPDGGPTVTTMWREPRTGRLTGNPTRTSPVTDPVSRGAWRPTRPDQSAASTRTTAPVWGARP